MSITEFFSNSKTRDLSDELNHENVKIQRICRTSLTSSHENENIFTEGLDPSGSRKILSSCLSNLKTKAKKRF